MSETVPRARPRARRAAAVASYVAVWLVTSALIALALFLSSTRTITLASHDAVVQPDLSGDVVVRTGPVLPDLKMKGPSRIGLSVALGKTDATSTDELVRRYAYIAGQPEGQVAKAREAVQDMAIDALLRGAILGLVPIGVWVLVGRRRRADLRARLRPVHVAVAVAVLALVAAGLWQPWTDEDETVGSGAEWQSLQDFLGPEVHVPQDLQAVRVRGDVTTAQTRRLIESAVDTYDKSKVFYATAAEQAKGLSLHQPGDGETVVAFVSDRHDNIGMDPVARAIGDAGQATAVFDGGDDTSVGKSWEAFSLDSVSEAFHGLDRWGVSGNHDNGSFVHRYLADHDWTMLDGKVVDGPAGTTLLGVDDPRSSGLGSWRDASELSFSQVGDRLADVACDADERVTTLLVHDANLGRAALERGCVDLVLGGHTHVRAGPTRIVGSNGAVGYSYTTGTTGGAAYAIAIGSKPRRPADVSLVTYAEGRPVGIQAVTLQSNGVFQVAGYVPLAYPDQAAERSASTSTP